MSSVLNHAVVVGGSFRNRLQNIPMLNDFPLLHSENINRRASAILRILFPVRMDCYQIVFSNDPLDGSRRLWIVLEKLTKILDRGFFAVRNSRVVLDIGLSYIFGKCLFHLFFDKGQCITIRHVFFIVRGAVALSGAQRGPQDSTQYQQHSKAEKGSVVISISYDSYGLHFSS